MSILEFGRDVFGVDPPAAPVLGQTFYHSPEQKKLFLARYYRDIMTGRRAPPPPPPPRGGGGGGGGGAPRAPSAPSGFSQSVSQTVNIAKQVPGMVNAAKSGFSALSSLASGLSNGDVDPNVSADASINGEFFDDELTWPGHRHYTYMWPFRTGPLGAEDPFTNADFGFEEEFMSASNQLPAMVRG